MQVMQRLPQLERRARGKVVLDVRRDEQRVREPDMQNTVLHVLQCASEAIGPEDLSPFKAIWRQWEAQGTPRGDKGFYLQAEEALKQALAELGETNVPEFARSRDVQRYAAALREAIRSAERRDS
jgi:hypothetical protein